MMHTRDSHNIFSSPSAAQAVDSDTLSSDFRAGFVSIVGRPNVGKSTLTNALVGRKIAITSARPETTRRVIRAIVTRPTGQLILVDTPGLHRPRTLLGERLNDMVRESLADVDVIVMCIPATDKIGPGDKFLLNLARETKQKIVIAVTKIDLVSKEELARTLAFIAQEIPAEAYIPVSAQQGDNTEHLAHELINMMPVSPPLYPLDAITDEDEKTFISELIREAALEELHDELPHSLAVTIDEMGDVDSRLVVHASLNVERDSQKGIIIGKGGSRLKKIGTRARKNISALIGGRVYLDLHVKVEKEWQRDPKKLGKLGF